MSSSRSDVVTLFVSSSIQPLVHNTSFLFMPNEAMELKNHTNCILINLLDPSCLLTYPILPSSKQGLTESFLY